jgi:hypothetical protein
MSTGIMCAKSPQNAENVHLIVPAVEFVVVESICGVP